MSLLTCRHLSVSYDGKTVLSDLNFINASLSQKILQTFTYFSLMISHSVSGPDRKSVV